MGAQQFVCHCHRATASIERTYEIGDRSASLPGVGNNSTDRRECVLDAMVELGQQSALLLLHPFSLGYVNADADDPVRMSTTVVSSETAGLDPTHLVASTNDTILYAIFAPTGLKRFAADLFHPPYVVGVHAREAFPASYLGSTLRKAMEGRITFRNLHDLRVAVVRVTANEGRLSC